MSPTRPRTPGSMAKLTAPLLSLIARGGIAGVAQYRRARGNNVAAAMPRTTARAPTPAQRAHRQRLTTAIDYSHNVPAEDVDAIEALARSRRIPFQQAAVAYWFETNPPPVPTIWDGGATLWDDGFTIWDA